uniref:Ig-like domain-containing protein n=1 Tax=Anopheles epiroticus TaxID=199890 RepID=A0A182P5X8_9DIPT
MPQHFLNATRYPQARAEIVGPQVKYLTPDSTLKLICRVVQSTEASAFIFWYHNNRMINYDLDRGINVSTEAATIIGRREQLMHCGC